jgi:hypothetical protein
MKYRSLTSTAARSNPNMCSMQSSLA